MCLFHNENKKKTHTRILTTDKLTLRNMRECSVTQLRFILHCRYFQNTVKCEMLVIGGTEN